MYDTGEDEFAGNPVPYIVMEYVEGSTLRDLLASGNRLVPERALEIVDGVLAALAYSHQQGIVHRDIKPANVMLTAAGEVKVMDFGIARSLDDMSATMTQTSAVIGTAQYLSPEQARGEQVDARSDLYSTGCLLYELLTGRPPFVGDSPVSVAYQHVREEPVPPSQVDPDVSASVEAIVLKSLTKDRDNRYQTADEMRRDIAAALAGRPVAAVLPPPVTGEPADPAHHRAAGHLHHPAGRWRQPPRRRDGRGGRALGYALLGLAVVAVFVIAALIARSVLDGSGGSDVAVPDVVGLTVADARSDLQADGLQLGTETPKAHDTVPEGNIIDQSPESGSMVEEGAAVSVTVSTGADEAVVPSLVGLSLDEARQALNQAGLELGETDPVASDETRNTVVRVSPNEAEIVPAGSSVDLKLRQRQQQGAQRGRSGRGHRPQPHRAGRLHGGHPRGGVG